MRGNVLSISFGILCAGAVSAQPLGSAAVAHVSVAAAASLYELADPLPLSSARWDPLFDSRLELSAGLLPRHEVRVSAASRAGYGGWETGLAGFDPGWTLDPARATYRYTVMERRDWAWKVGITQRLGETGVLRAGAFDRTRLGSLPLVHLAGEARLATNWLLAVDADGLMTARGRALDLGVRVDYALGRSLTIFGRYRLSDRYAEGDEMVGPGQMNSANVGLRYRF